MTAGNCVDVDAEYLEAGLQRGEQSRHARPAPASGRWRAWAAGSNVKLDFADKLGVPLAFTMHRFQKRA